VLPSLESITSVTDVRAFLAPGVPQELTRAALRRAWATDPAIRDFVGIQDNDWDFTKPEGMLGFGPLPPDLDVKKLIAQIFGEAHERPADVRLHDAARTADELQAASGSQELARSATPARPVPTEQPPQVQPRDAQTVIVQRSNGPEFVTQDDLGSSPVETTVLAPRKHGSALPKV